MPLPYWHGSRQAGPAKLLPNFSRILLENASENAQKPQEINIACPKRSCDETPVEGAKQLLQAVKFAAKNMPGFRLGLDEDFQMAGCFQELIRATGLVEPYMMRGLQPLGPNRTTLEVIIPSHAELTCEKWKETATLCPLDWPSNYSLLRLWHTNGSLHQTEARLRNQLSHSHMFAEWTVHLHRFAERVLFQQPAVYVADMPCKPTCGNETSQTGKSAGGFRRKTWTNIKGRSERFCSVRLSSKE